DPLLIKRNICAAGHKAMYHEQWGGLPSMEFLEALSPHLPRLRTTFPPAVCADQTAGLLAPERARDMGLHPGIPIAVGAIGAHLRAVGSGISPGPLVKIIGTSTCDCLV